VWESSFRGTEGRRKAPPTANEIGKKRKRLVHTAPQARQKKTKKEMIGRGHRDVKKKKKEKEIYTKHGSNKRGAKSTKRRHTRNRAKREVEPTPIPAGWAVAAEKKIKKKKKKKQIAKRNRHPIKERHKKTGT